MAQEVQSTTKSPIPSRLPEKSWFGLQRQTVWLAFSAILIASAFSILTLATDLPWIVSAALNLTSIASSALAGLVISRDQLRAEMREREDEKLREVTAMAAGELNNVFVSLTQLAKTWSFIADQFHVDASTKRSVTDSFYGIQAVIQNSIQSVIRLGPGGDNPFRLYRYTAEVACPTLDCEGVIDAHLLPPYPRSVFPVVCKRCKKSYLLRRRYDGSIVAGPLEKHKRIRAAVEAAIDPTPLESPMVSVPTVDEDALVAVGTLGKPKPKLVEHSVACPGCNERLNIRINEWFEYANRGCPNCQTVFTYYPKAEKLEKRERNYNKVISANDIFIDEKEHTRRVRCGCGRTLGAKYITPNKKGEFWLNCHGCGSILMDQEKLLIQ